jgi:hypothetical protein
MPILLRLPLSLLLGYLIAIPICLKIFEPEIMKYWEEQFNVSLQNKNEIKVDKVKSEVKLLEDKERLLCNERTELEHNIKSSNLMPIGTKNDGNSIYHDSNFSYNTNIRVHITELKNEIQEVKNKINIKSSYLNDIEQQFKELPDDILDSKFKDVSIGERYETLETVINDPKHLKLKNIHFWIQTFLVAIELMPVLMKIFTDLGVYDLFIYDNFLKNRDDFLKNG